MTFSFGTTPVYVSEGQTIRLKFKAPSAWDTTQSVTVQIGDQQTIWYISTIPEDFAPDPYPFTPLDDVTPDILYVYGDGTRAQEDIIEVSGLTPGSSASVSLVSSYLGANIDDYAVRIQLVHQGEADFGSWVIPASNIFVQNGDRVQLRLRSNDTGGLTRVADLSIGARTERWTITSALQPPNIPEPFPDFDEISGTPVDTDVYSEILRVTGLNDQAVVNTDNGARIGISTSNAFVVNDQGYNVLDGITFVDSSTNPTIQNGEYIQLVLTTPATSTTTTTNLLSIGDAVAGSSWGVTTGSFPSTTPGSFVFNDALDALEDTLIASDIKPASGIVGLGNGVTVPVTLVSTDGTEPRVKIYYDNGTESSIGIFPTDVSNGDRIQIYNKSDATFGGTIATTIKVGTLQIPTWSIVTNTGPDTDAAFTPPNNLTNRAPNRQYVSSIVAVTGINRDITINGTNGVLISIDFDTPVVGPRTFTPDNSSFQLYINASGLASTVSTTVVVGTGASNQFTWNVSTYAVAPPAPELKGTWYSRKNSYTYEDTNGDVQLRNAKDDGLAIGTVLSVLKQPNGSYGTIDGDLDSRYPGFIECDGRPLSKTEYLDLFAVIGTHYGQSDANGNTGTTHFKVPDYRNRKLTGVGVVDGNRASSAFLPTNNINEPGNTGGWWYVDKVDVAGDNPYEQILQGGSQAEGKVQTFALWQNKPSVDAEYIERTVGQYVNRGEGGNPDYWTAFGESQEEDVLVLGGTGSGLRLRVRAEANDLDGSGNPDDTRVTVVSILDPGTGYQAGDLMDIGFSNAAPGGGTVILSPGIKVLTVTSTPVINSDEGTESNFFNFGTVKTQFNAPITADVEFTVNGTVTAQIGQLQEKLIDVPTHTHLFVSAFTAEGFGGTGLIPWNTQILANAGLGQVNKSTGTGDGPYINFIGGNSSSTDDDIYREQPDVWYPQYQSELRSKTQPGGNALYFDQLWDDILQSNEQVTFKEKIVEWAATFGTAPLSGPAGTKSLLLSSKVFWPSPYNSLNPDDVVGVAQNHENLRRYPEDVYGQTGPGATAVSAAIDVTGTEFRIEAYTPPAILEDSDTTTSSHNHLMGLTPVLDPTQDYSWGNQNGPGLFKEGLGGFGTTLNVSFDNNQFVGNTPPVGYVLNTGTFTLNQNIKKPIPSVKMKPNIQVPIVQEFHKVKYIIKAY